MAQYAADLVRLFNQTFSAYNTRLVAGAEEPLYQPALTAGAAHQIFFTRDYFASALHEVAHWCIAGDARRRQVDYGYWYCPDGRDAQQQTAFEQVEVKPQAIEWLFSQAAGVRFRLSADNLNAATGSSQFFAKSVYAQVQTYLRTQLPSRAMLFVQALQAFYQTAPLCSEDFALEGVL